MLALVNFLKPEKILDKGGLALLSLIVFAESGLLVGFFLPGDSLLFVAGFLSSDAGHHKLPALPFVVVCVVAAAIVGDQVGYLFGRKVGPALFTRPDSRSTTRRLPWRISLQSWSRSWARWVSA